MTDQPNPQPLMVAVSSAIGVPVGYTPQQWEKVHGLFEQLSGHVERNGISIPIMQQMRTLLDAAPVATEPRALGLNDHATTEPQPGAVCIAVADEQIDLIGIRLLQDAAFATIARTAPYGSELQPLLRAHARSLLALAANVPGRLLDSDIEDALNNAEFDSMVTANDYLYVCARAIEERVRQCYAAPGAPVQAAQPDACEVAVSEAFLAHWCRDVPPAFLQSAKDNARKRLEKGGATSELLAAFAAWAAALATTPPAPDAEPTAAMVDTITGAAGHNDAAGISKELVRLADILRDCNRLVCPEGAAETVLREAAASLALASSGGAAAGDTRRELDMAMIVRRIVSSARRHCDGNSPLLKLANEAWDYIYRNGLGGSPLRDAALPAATGLTAQTVRAARSDLQPRVQPWLMECFGPMIAGDREERNHRFIEEALELVQACGCSASEAHQLVDYVFGRPVGEKGQEVGGVMITLAALCLANDLDMHAEGERELARIWTMVEKIRAKQAAKPKHSPLPEAAPKITAAPPAETRDAEDAFEQFKAWPCTTSINNLRMRLDEAECYINAKVGISKL